MSNSIQDQAVARYLDDLADRLENFERYVKIRAHKGICTDADAQTIQTERYVRRNR